MLAHSKWHVNGRPTRCALEPCSEKLDGTYFHAADGRYYCGEECAVEAENFGLPQIDNLARRVA
jgi:hypothetical protein